MSNDVMVVDRNLLHHNQKEKSVLPVLRDIKSANDLETNKRRDIKMGALALISPEIMNQDVKLAARPPLPKKDKNINFYLTRKNTSEVLSDKDTETGKQY